MQVEGKKVKLILDKKFYDFNSIEITSKVFSDNFDITRKETDDNYRIIISNINETNVKDVGLQFLNYLVSVEKKI